MIPKTIHYCWFGGASMDERSLRCIESWKKFFPDYEISRWDETNIDLTQINFMREAFEQGKWAFVSDVARLIVVYQNGGIYFDTDVEVISSYDDVLSESPAGFMGYEVTGYVNTGLGFGAEKGNAFLRDIIKRYRDISFIENMNNLSEIACPIITTKLMKEQGYDGRNRFQVFRGLNIYPTSYYSPLNYENGRLRISNKTHSIHWGNASWSGEIARNYQMAVQKYNRVFGKKMGEIIYGIDTSIKNEGLLNYVKRHM